jgi:membrane protein YdbS with pleckstrin-like domain
MRHCTNCGATLTPGVRFCGACGAPVAADEADETRVTSSHGNEDELTRLSDTEATRLAHDTEATRVAARSLFDDQRITPARVERLGGDANYPVASQSQRAPQSSYGQSATQAVSRQQSSQVPTRDAATEDAERVVFSVRPTMLFVGLGYALAVLAAIGLTILLAKFNLLPALYSVLVSLPLLLVPAFYHLRRNTIKYTLTDAKIEIDRGLIARRTRNIPLRNIQDVTVAATIPQRLLGFGDLIIDNASELGGSTIMHNIPAPRRHADLLLRELRRWN